MEVARRPTLKSPFLPWMVLMANWPGSVIMRQLLTMMKNRETSTSEDRRLDGGKESKAPERGLVGQNDSASAGVSAVSVSGIASSDAGASWVAVSLETAGASSRGVSSEALGSAL